MPVLLNPFFSNPDAEQRSQEQAQSLLERLRPLLDLLTKTPGVLDLLPGGGMMAFGRNAILREGLRRGIGRIVPEGPVSQLRIPTSPQEIFLATPTGREGGSLGQNLPLLRSGDRGEEEETLRFIEFLLQALGP